MSAGAVGLCAIVMAGPSKEPRSSVCKIFFIVALIVSNAHKQGKASLRAYKNSRAAGISLNISGK